MVDNNKRMPDATLKNVDLLPRPFRNFEGRGEGMNAAGHRNFCISFDQETADAMIRDGWNVRYLKPREEGDDPKPYLKVKVNFNGPRPPQLVMVTSRGRTFLDENTAELIDVSRVKKTDLIVSPYNYDVNGKTGVTAYLKKIFVTIEEDELDMDYADVPDAHAPRGRNNGPRFVEDDDTPF